MRISKAEDGRKKWFKLNACLRLQKDCRVVNSPLCKRILGKKISACAFASADISVSAGCQEQAGLCEQLGLCSMQDSLAGSRAACAHFLSSHWRSNCWIWRKTVVLLKVIVLAKEPAFHHSTNQRLGFRQRSSAPAQGWGAKDTAEGATWSLCAWTCFSHLSAAAIRTL